MRLLDVETLQLSEFFDSSVPPYVILSHTWDKDETSFQEIRSDHSTLKGKAGFEKIKGACKIAQSDGFKYIWIDTCCIDKTSSAELSEAINSMFRWYKDAYVCYVFLSDVHTASGPKDHDSQFRLSRWFMRGWTLQELLAPRSLIFYTSFWEELGTKCDLQGLIEEITKIPSGVVEGWRPMTTYNYSIAQKMSWAASRSTTREEDRAYSLMGIFNVNMPMLYGEGRSAFRRLQEEIMKRGDDQSLFAWKLSQDQQREFGWAEPYHLTGLLAPDPCAFAESGSVISLATPDGEGFRTTNVAGGGIMLSLPLVPSPYEEETDAGLSYVALYCCDISGGHSLSRLGIQVEDFLPNFINYRVNAEILRSVEIPRPVQRQMLHFMASPGRDFDLEDRRDQRIWVDSLERKGFRIERTVPKLSLRDGNFTIHDIQQMDIRVLALRYLGEGGRSFVLFIRIRGGTVLAKPFQDVLWEDEFDRWGFLAKYDKLSSQMTERSRWYSEDSTWGVDVAIKRRLVDGERCICVCLEIIDGPRTKRQ
ncbi:ankyrin 2,3/unc44 [Halenospora varia]|nr:ankyrin 2,3/unc44 [Halenospora varia]